jgi:outer membrane receptor protein involved in Fe transport
MMPRSFKNVRLLPHPVLVAVLLAVSGAFNAPTQVTTATFYGIVTDASGAAIPGATATLTNVETNQSQAKVTDNSGEFTFDYIRVGQYSIVIEAKGFKRFSATGFNLQAGQNVRRTFSMEVGNVTESVAVTAQTPLVNAVSSEQLETVSELRVSELPLSRRNFTGLLQLNTGVTQADGAMRLNGTGKSGTLYTVDGTPATADPESRTSSMRGNWNYINLLSVDAIQEVQVVKGVIPAEYGGALGGNVNVLTKSGTNTWHGGVFENFQAEDLNARLQFLGNKPSATFNQFGGSVGGPIIRDRLFIFGTYEGYRESAARLVSGNVPTQQFRDTLIAAVPAYKPALDTLPLPNTAGDPTATTGFYQSAKALRSSDNHAVLKSDYHLTNSSNLAFTYTRGRPYQLNPRLDVDNNQVYEGVQERGTASFVTGGPSWTADSRFGYSLNDMQRVDDFFLQGIPETEPFGGRSPQLSTALGFSTSAGELWLVEGPIWSIEQKFSRYTGPHSLKFGGRFVHNGGGRTNPESPAVTYNTMADLLANTPSRVQITFGNGLYNGNNWELGFFAQDDWRVNRKLVLNLGLRYDFFSKMVAKSRVEGSEYGFYNLDGLIDSQFHFGPQRSPDDPYNSDGWVNLGPRVGFSYDPTGGGNTVIRGGLSVMFSPFVGGMMKQAVGSRTVPFRSIFSKLEAEQAGLRFPIYADQARAYLEGKNQPAIFSVFNPQIQNPYTVNVYLGVQHSLTSTIVLETAFVGNRGIKYPLHRVFNQVDRLSGVRPNLDLGEGYYVDNSQNTLYTSWQSSLRKRFAQGFTASAHYTWGKALATENGDIGGYYQGVADVRVQDFFNLRAERGPADGDITHYFAADAVYDLPTFASSPGLVRHTIGGWQASGIFTAATGQPLLILQGGARETSRPDYVGGNPITSDYQETLQYLNTAAFAKIPISSASGRTTRPGNLGSGAVRGPGFWNADFSLGKNFMFTEQTRLQIRMDAFNFLNHTNLTTFSTDINNARFGKFTNTRGARVIQLNARFSF